MKKLIGRTFLMGFAAVNVVSFQNCSSSSNQTGFATNQSSSASTGSSSGSSNPVTVTPPSPSPTPVPDPTTWNTSGLPAFKVTGGSQPVKFPFPTWNGGQVAVSASTTGKTYYVDTKSGNDTNTGTSTSAALKTIGASVKKVVAGDTVLIRTGLYREVVDMSDISGSSGKPITFGAFGDGEVIIDGSTAVTGWTNVSGSIWKVTISGGNSVNAVVVNNSPLVNYKTTKSVPTSGSGLWYFDGSSTLYADMGSADPTSSNADILVVKNNHGGSTIFLGASSFLNLVGLTVRGSGWAGIWNYPVSQGVGGHNLNVAFCDIKFNDGAGLAFSGGSNNSALYNHIYYNVLNNWPFGANGNGAAGGGWPGSLVWSTDANPLARGNVVAMNGGEGIISYGNGISNGLQSGNTLFEQNVSYDNWSMNSYVDNQPNHVIRNNLFFRHAPNVTWMWDQSDTYTTEKFRTCLALADEYASGNPAGTAAMANAQVYNNLMVGCRYGISDYSEDVTGHGMKNDVIVNNTIIMDNWNYTQESYAGILIGDNGSSNTNTSISGNIIYRPNTCNTQSNSCPLIGTQGSSKLSGISLNNNLYFASGSPNTATSLFATNSANSSSPQSFSGWVSFEGQDSSSLYVDPLLVDSSIETATTIDYTKAAVNSNSPAKGLAVPKTTLFNFDFKGVSRGASWTAGAFQ